MADDNPRIHPSLKQLVFVPGLITLAVTILRLTGELQHWSKPFFNPEVGGPWSIVGIAWLAPIFGVYFAVKLSLAGEGPRSVWRAAGYAALAVVVIYGLGFAGSRLHIGSSIQGRLVYIWAASAVAALVTLPGWPALFKTVLAYAYSARIPVAVVMYFAFLRNWGTHYDALPSDMPAGAGFWSKFLWLGFFPQMIFWVGYTIVTGMLFGSVAALLVRAFRLMRGQAENVTVHAR
jgi:hypothetical protein